MISDQAFISGKSKIAKNVEIGPWSYIGDNVEIDEDCVIGPHVIIKGPTKIGKKNKFFQFSSIGEDCQDKKYHNELTELIIGDNNSFREGCTVHRGTVQGGGKTVIGNNGLFMVNTHIAHDCIIGNNVIFSNGANVAGHVTVDDYACLGGLSGVHQFCSIGKHSFAAGGAIIYKDVLPYVIVSGYPAEVNGINQVGLERNNYSEESIKLIRKAYKIIFRSSKTIKDVIVDLKEIVTKSSDIEPLISFIQNSKRGIVR